MSAPARRAGRLFLVRDLDAGRLLDTFFVAAVASILMVRAALSLAGWPQLGGSSIHFAHLLWGGIGMLAGIIVLLSLQGRFWRQIGALGCGLGWGLFIDELGKFITADNDYFFKPTMAIIYLTFVALYLIFRALSRVPRVSPETALVNAFDEGKEVVLRDMDEGERRRGLDLLSRCDPDDPVVRALQGMLADLPATAIAEAPLASRVRSRLAGWYDGVVRFRFFKVLMVGYFVGSSVVALVFPFTAEVDVGDLSVGEAGQVLSGLAMGLLTVVGLVRWRHSRLAAYRWFARAALVNIFVGQFFAFYEQQLTAVVGLVAMLVTVSVLRYMIDAEQTRSAAAAA